LHRASFSPHPQPPAGPHRTVLLLLRSKAVPPPVVCFLPGVPPRLRGGKDLLRARKEVPGSLVPTHTETPKLDRRAVPSESGQCRGRPVSGIGVTALLAGGRVGGRAGWLAGGLGGTGGRASGTVSCQAPTPTIMDPANNPVTFFFFSP
jgi:hypothetical protein